MNKKYELTSEFIEIKTTKLFRIKALRDFGNVREGNSGGFIEKESNLAHDGNAWVSGNARVYGNAQVSGNVWIVYGNICFDTSDNIEKTIRASLNIVKINGKFYFYKKVFRISDSVFKTSYDGRDFLYELFRTSVVENADPDKTVSCSSGIHCADSNYLFAGDTTIIVEVLPEDIITCLEGKVRCKKVKVVGVVE